MKKLKICLSVATVCLAIAVFCFGVIAATNVTYTIGGSVSYVVTDAFVDIKTRVYTSKEKATSDTKLLAKSNYLTSTTYITNALENGTLTEVEKYSDGRLDVNTLQDQREPAIYPDQTPDTKINIDYSNSNYTWYIVVSITNIADNTVWANVSGQTFTGDFNSFANYTGGIDSIAKDETKSIVLGFSVKDEKTSIKDSTFDYSLTISADQDAKPVLDTNPRVESVGKYYTSRNVSSTISNEITSISIEPQSSHGNFKELSEYIIDNNFSFSSVDDIPDDLKLNSLINLQIPDGVTSFPLILDTILSNGTEKMSMAEMNANDNILIEKVSVINRKVNSFLEICERDEYKNAKSVELKLTTIPTASISDENATERTMILAELNELTSNDITIVVKYSGLCTLYAALLSQEDVDLSFSNDLYTNQSEAPITLGQKDNSSFIIEPMKEKSEPSYFYSVFDVPQNADSAIVSYNMPSYIDNGTTRYRSGSIIALKNDVSSSIEDKYKSYLLNRSEIIGEELYNNYNSETNNIRSDKIYGMNGLQKFTLILDYSLLSDSEIQEFKFNSPFAFNMQIDFKDKDNNTVGTASVPALNRNITHIEVDTSEMKTTQYYFAYSFDIATDTTKVKITLDRTISLSGNTSYLYNPTMCIVKGDTSPDDIAKHKIADDGWLNSNCFSIKDSYDSTKWYKEISDLSGYSKATIIYFVNEDEILSYDYLNGYIANLIIECKKSDDSLISTITQDKLVLQSIEDYREGLYGCAINYTAVEDAEKVEFKISFDESNIEQLFGGIREAYVVLGEWSFDSFCEAMMNGTLSESDVLWYPGDDSVQEDMSIVGSFNIPDGVKNFTLVALFSFSKTVANSLDVGNSMPCDIKFSSVGYDATKVVKVNYNTQDEHLTIKKAYLEGEEGNFSFDKSGNYYYQNFQVKNYFDKYDEMYLYFGGMEGEYSVLKGNRDSIGSDLTDIIATVNSRNGIVKLTKDMGEDFCLVSNNPQSKMTMKPSLENVTFEYKILKDNTVSITKYWDNGAKSLTIPESIDGHIVSTIGQNALRNVGSLTKLVVPDTVTKISDYSLYSPNLTDVTLPFLEGIYNEDWDFRPLPSGLETLTLTKSGEFFFQSTNGTTRNLKTIVFGDDIEKININNSDFANVQNISFGNKVKSIEIVDGNLVNNNTSNGLTIFTARDNETKFLYKVDSSLTTVTKEQLAGVKVINERAFSSCDALTSVEIPVGVKELPERLFDTPNLTSLSLPSTISYIGLKTFVSTNNSGSDVIIPWYRNLSCDVNGLKIVNAYDDVNVKFLLGSDSEKVTAKTLTSTMLNGVKVIYDNALSNCGNVEKIELPNSVVFIGNGAFYYCWNLKSINIPSNVIEIGSSAFSYTDITNIKIPGEISEIKDNTFQWCDKLTTVSLPNSLKKIGSSAFYYCNLLNNINLPNGLEYIGEKAFGYCKSLNNINLPNRLEYIGEGAFSGCEVLGSIYIPESVNYIGEGAYSYNSKYPILYGCNSLSKIVVSPNNKKYTSANSNCIINKENGKLINGCKSSTIPGIVKEIGAYAFYGVGIEKVVVPSSVESIGDYAFTSCEKLVTISLSNGIKKIGYSVFSGCTSLEKVTLPDSITSLGGGLFQSCSNLKSVVLPKNITSIAYSMFSGCKSLTSITIPSSVTRIDERAFASSGLTSIKIPSSVKGIDNNAFSQATNLQTVELPSSLEHIGIEAFYNTKYFNNMQADGNGLKIASAYDNNNVKYVLGYSPNSSNPSITADMLKGVQVFQRHAFNHITFETFEVPNTLKRFRYYDIFGNSTINTLKIPSRFFSDFRYTSVKNFILTSDDTEIIDEFYSSDYKNSESIEIASAIKELTLGDNYNNEHGSFEQLKTITFAENSQLESIEIGSSMKNLTTLNLPKNIKHLDIAKETAWYKNLTADENGLIIVPSSEDASVKYLVGYNADTLNANITAEMLNGVTVFADSIFNNCKKLASIEIPSTVDIIPSYAFSGCTNLRNITFKGIIKKVGNYAFDDVQITKMRFPVGLEQVGRNIFGGYRSSTINVELPSTLTEIEDDAFEYIFSEDGNGLIITTAYDNPNYRFLLGANRGTVENKSITLDMIKNVKVIADWALNDMDIKSIEIPSDIVKIGRGALAMIDTLNEITMSGENERYAVEGNCLVDKKTKTLMVAGRKCTIPQDLGIEVIDDYAFYRLNNSSFKDSKNIVIPNTVKKIGHNAFGFQDNLTITMPTSIEYLDEILWNCHDITVIYQGTLAQWNKITIKGNSSKNATIICTDGETTAAL